MDRLALIAELLEAAADPEPRVGGVDPVVHFIERCIDAELWIDLRETGQDHFALVGPAVPIGVGEMENVGGTGDQDPPLPGQHAMGHVEPVDKHAAVLEPAVAVPVLEQLDPGEGLVGDRDSPSSRRRTGGRVRRTPWRWDPRPGARQPPARSGSLEPVERSGEPPPESREVPCPSSRR